jgi:hypothetical protein
MGQIECLHFNQSAGTYKFIVFFSDAILTQPIAVADFYNNIFMVYFYKYYSPRRLSLRELIYLLSSILPDKKSCPESYPWCILEVLRGTGRPRATFDTRSVKLPALIHFAASSRHQYSTTAA